jgi:hypothetical protein
MPFNVCRRLPAKQKQIISGASPSCIRAAFCDAAVAFPVQAPPIPLTMVPRPSQFGHGALSP